MKVRYAHLINYQGIDLKKGDNYYYNGLNQFNDIEEIDNYHDL